MSVDEKPRESASSGRAGRLARGLVSTLVSTERAALTREGLFYCAVMAILLAAGMLQRMNLILLVATTAAGPIVASLFGSRAMMRRLGARRRTPAHIFAGDALTIEYALENDRRRLAALAVFVEDQLVPADRSTAVAALPSPRVFFPRVGAGDRARVRWRGEAPRRGKYHFQSLVLGTRSPFGLIERRVTTPLPEQLVVYPRVGRLSRRWRQLQRQATEHRMGRRHDRSAQQEEYHGLRDYRAGDSLRWIHWRTSARLGELMVKEYEQQNEQDLAILVDPWLPRAQASPRQREAVEQAVSFAATICLETCRRQGRRLVVGWTGTAPGVVQGPSSVKLLHELLEQMAVLRPTHEGRLAELFDALPPATLRDAMLIVVSTRPLNLMEEADRSARLSSTAARGPLSRAVLLNAGRDELNNLIHFDEADSLRPLERRLSGDEADRIDPRVSEGRRRGRPLDEPGDDGETSTAAAPTLQAASKNGPGGRA